MLLVTMGDARTEQKREVLIAIVFLLKPSLTSSCITRASLAFMIMLAKNKIMPALIITCFRMIMLVLMIILSRMVMFSSHA